MGEISLIVGAGDAWFPTTSTTFDAEWLTPRCHDAVMREGTIHLSWELVIYLSECLFSDGEDAPRWLDKPDWLDGDSEEVLQNALRGMLLPETCALVLELSSIGVPGRSGYALRQRWYFPSGNRLEPQPHCVDGLVEHPGSGPQMMTFAQHQALLGLSSLPELGSDRNADLTATSELLARIPRGDTSVLLTGQLATAKIVVADRVRPQLVPIAGGFQVRPRVEGIPDEEMDAYYFETPASQLGKKGLNIRGEGFERTRAVFPERARESLHDARRLDRMSPADVAHAMSHPEGVFGPNLEHSSWSERVTGLGPEVAIVIPKLKEIDNIDWWDWDVLASEAPISADDTVEPEKCDVFSLKDPAIRAKLKEAIALAQARGDTYIPSPVSRKMIPLSRTLIDAIEGAEQLEQASQAAGGRLLKAPRLVLQVEMNLYEADFSRVGEHRLTRPTACERPPLLQQRFELHPYQQEGYEWLVALYQHGQREVTSWSGALLADDMGLGKTLQVLSFLSKRRESPSGPQLIVAPVALSKNWQDEARKFFGNRFEPILLAKGPLLAERDEAVRLLSRQCLVFTSYESMRENELVFAAVDWDVVIFDEAQKAKNPESQVARVARTLKARFRLALTGTPVENTLRELWAIVDWAVPGHLGSLHDFDKAYVRPLRAVESQSERTDLASRLHRVIEPIFTRRMKAEVAADKLPQIAFLAGEIPMSDEQLSAYNAAVAEAKAAPRPMAHLHKMFGVCAHPRYVAKSKKRLPRLSECPFPKGQKLIEILRAIENKGEKVIVFAKLKIIQIWLTEEIRQQFGLDPDLINGDITESDARLALIDKFSRPPGFNAIILSPRAAGVGLNITAANHVIHYMREWNPAVENQATDRAFRLGQERDVTVYTLTTVSDHGITVEQRLDQLLKAKRRLMQDFVVPIGGFTVTENELLHDEGERAQ